MGNGAHQKSSQQRENKDLKKLDLSKEYRVSNITEENEDLKRKIESF